MRSIGELSFVLAVTDDGEGRGCPDGAKGLGDGLAAAGAAGAAGGHVLVGCGATGADNGAADACATGPSGVVDTVAVATTEPPSAATGAELAVGDGAKELEGEDVPITRSYVSRSFGSRLDRALGSIIVVYLIIRYLKKNVKSKIRKLTGTIKSIIVNE